MYINLHQTQTKLWIGRSDIFRFPPLILFRLCRYRFPPKQQTPVRTAGARYELRLWRR